MGKIDQVLFADGHTESSCHPSIKGVFLIFNRKTEDEKNQFTSHFKQKIDKL